MKATGPPSTRGARSRRAGGRVANRPAGSLAAAVPELVVSPRGRLHFRPPGPGAPATGLPPRLAKALVRELADGLGPGLLALASRHLAAPLPADLSFGRSLAKRYLQALAATPEGEGEEHEGPPAPEAELGALLEALPPLLGGEYADAASLQQAWAALDEAVASERADFPGSLHEYLQSKNPAWHGVGRLTLHLAEQRGRPLTPFAFLATRAEGVGESGRLRHVPLGQALERAKGDPAALLRLLRPLNAACERSPFIRELTESGDVFHPLSWTAEEAHAFLQAVPDCEAAGLAVRVPDWWSKPSPVRATARVGAAPASGLGLEALLDFRAALTLGGEELTDEEREELLSGTRGLRLLRGRWVEVDPERLREALAFFESLGREAGEQGLPLGQALRLMAGSGGGLGEAELEPEGARWAGVEAGPWLAGLLEELKSPVGRRAVDPGRALRATLRPYQRDGVAWLWLLHRLGLGGCLADDMGLGKTVQVIALLLLLRKHGEKGPHLVVLPTSLLGNWQEELARFAPGLRVLVAHASELPRAELGRLRPARLRTADVVLTTYGTLPRLEGLAKTSWGLVVLDEAQAIKNPGTRAAKAARALKARSRLALTGTPIENRLGDLWSLFEFLCPGLLGTRRRFAEQTRKLATGEADPAPLRRLLRPYLLRRLKTDPTIVPELPEKSELTVHCGLSRLQASLYEAAVRELDSRIREAEPMERRGLVLSYLMRFKQICNHPSLFTGEEDFDPAASGKFQRLTELCEVLAARQERLLVFTQFRQLTGALARHLEGLFGRPGLVLHGGTAVRERQALVKRFQAEDGPPFFVLSLKAGGTGLNLTAACHVVHFDRWWNPAVENQATDRAFRIGQVRNVLVHAFSCRGTVEEKIDALLASKRELAEGILDFSGEAALTELPPDELLELVSLDADRALAG